MLTPLQLTAAASLLQNQGIKPLPPALTTAIANYGATTLIANWIAAVTAYKTKPYFTETTFDALLSIGNSVCPALGNSIPVTPLGTYQYLTADYLTPNTVTDTPTIDPTGFALLIEQIGSSYLGDGEIGKMAQGFMAVQGFISVTNDFLNSSTNAAQYLGPTFSTMDALTTADISNATTDLEAYGVDLANQGQLFDTANLELYGTPAGLLQQLSAVAGVQNQAMPGVQEVLIATGMTETDITNLVNDNQESLLNPNGVSANEFDKLQKIAYRALSMVPTDVLTQVLSILDIKTPNVTSMEQLLDPTVMFPNSYTTLLTPSPNGPILIFGSNGAVNSSIAPTVNSYLPTSSGCDELGKIIPPADAIANKAIQLALQQINNISNVPLPVLANAILGNIDNPWDNTQPYLPNDVVSVGAPIPTYYTAQQDVPEGTDITDTDFWEPTTLGGLSTMDGLPLIQAQTETIDPSVVAYFASQATGSGPDGTLTTYDILGTAIDSHGFTAQLNIATSTINTLDGLGALTALNTTYSDMLLAANNAAWLVLIGTANSDIVTIAAAQPSYVSTLNGAWVAIANKLNYEQEQQTYAGIDYFTLQSGEKISTYAFVQNLPNYGELTAAGDACEFLQNIADTTVLGGQAIIGTMREGRNDDRLADAGITPSTNVPSEPPLAPIPVVLPVN